MTAAVRDALRILRAVRDGASDEDAVASATGIAVRRVLLIAAALCALPGRDDPGLLCALDGEAWCPTEAGYRLLSATEGCPWPR